MKKIIFTLILAFIPLSESFAISYGGSSNYQLPTMTFSISGSNWLITPTNTFVRQWLWSITPTSSTRQWQGLSCFRYTGTWPNGYILTAWWMNNWAYQGVQYSTQVTSSWVALVDTLSATGTNTALFSDTYTPDSDSVMLYLPPPPYSSSWDNALVVCIRPIFSHIHGEWSYYDGTNVYIYGYSWWTTTVSQFVPRSIRMRGLVDNYWWMYSFLWYSPSFRENFIPDSSYTGSVNSYAIVPYYTNTYYQPSNLFPVSSFAWTQYFYNNTEFNFVKTLPEFFSSTNTGVFVEYSWTWGSSSGTSSSPYFSSCSWFDFGCYIGWAFSASIGFVLGFFDFSFLSTGNQISCGSDSSFSMSGGIVYSGTFHNPLAQKVLKVVSVAVPVSPNDWDTLCTLMWDKVIHYRDNSWFDLFITVVCSFGVLLTLLVYAWRNN